MRRWGWVIASVVGVVVMPAAVGWFVWQGLPPPKDVTVFASAFGDIVGPLFAAFAFVGLLVTINAQRDGLANAEAQLKVSRLTARLNAATVVRQHYEDEIKRADGADDGNERLQSLRIDSEFALKDIHRLRDELNDFARYAEVSSETLPQGTAGTVTVKNP